MIIVGNAFTLSKALHMCRSRMACQDPYWQKWLAWCQTHGVVVDKQASGHCAGMALRRPGMLWSGLPSPTRPASV